MQIGHSANAKPLPVKHLPWLTGLDAPIRVLIAHASPVVAAGLFVTLGRNTQFKISVAEVAGHTLRAVSDFSGVDVVIADSTGTAAKLGLKVTRADTTTATMTRPRLLLLQVRGHGAEKPEFDAANCCDAALGIMCQETTLLETLQKLGHGHDLVSCREPRLASNDEAMPRPRGGMAPAALKRIRAHIDAAIASRIEIDDLAALANLSGCHFARAFKQSVGMPPHRYVMQRRVEIAASLLKDTDTTIVDLALAVGFADQSHFSRIFNQLMGETPRAFRKRHR